MKSAPDNGPSLSVAGRCAPGRGATGLPPPSRPVRRSCALAARTSVQCVPRALETALGMPVGIRSGAEDVPTEGEFPAGKSRTPPDDGMEA